MSDKEDKQAYKKFADKLKMKQLKGEGGRIKELRKMVQEFEDEFGTDINLMPAEMQIKYKKMRKDAGLPEISRIDLSSMDEPSLKNKNDYMIKLANTVLQLGINRKNETGGILSLPELIVLLKTQTPFKDVKVKDAKKVLKKLDKEGLIAGIEKLETEVEIIEFVPVSFSKDQNTILALASKDGTLTLGKAMTRLNWTKERILKNLETLEKSNIAKKDPRYAAGEKWYFPGLIESN
jgi:hypothetical protein